MVKITLILSTSGHASPSLSIFLKPQNLIFLFWPEQNLELFVYPNFQTSQNLVHESCSPCSSASSGEEVFALEPCVQREAAMPFLARSGLCQHRHGIVQRAPPEFGRRRRAPIPSKPCPECSPPFPYPLRVLAPPEPCSLAAER